MAIGFLGMKRGNALGRVVDPSESPEEAFGTAEFNALMRDAVADRPEAERRLIERHYFDGITLEEAAKELGLSKSWASRLHTRALEAISRTIRRSRTTSDDF